MKRGILSRLSGLYDPLGWASAFVVRAKALLQRTWARGLGWDAPLPPDMAAQWAQWEEEIATLRSFAVPRYYYKSPTKNWTKELGLFCDASEDDCDAAAYSRLQIWRFGALARILLNCLLPLAEEFLTES